MYVIQAQRTKTNWLHCGTARIFCFIIVSVGVDSGSSVCHAKAESETECANERTNVSFAGDRNPWKCDAYMGTERVLGTNVLWMEVVRVRWLTSATVARCRWMECGERCYARRGAVLHRCTQLRIHRISAAGTQCACVSHVYILFARRVYGLFFFLLFTSLLFDRFVHTHASQFPCQFVCELLLFLLLLLLFLFHVAFPVAQGKRLEYCRSAAHFIQIERVSNWTWFSVLFWTWKKIGWFRFVRSCFFKRIEFLVFYCHPNLNNIFNNSLVLKIRRRATYASFIVHVWTIGILGKWEFCHPFFSRYTTNKLRTLLLLWFISFLNDCILWPPLSLLSSSSSSVLFGLFIFGDVRRTCILINAVALNGTLFTF